MSVNTQQLTIRSWPFDGPLTLLLLVYLCFSFLLHTSAHLGQWGPMLKQLLNLSIGLSAWLAVSFMPIDRVKRCGIGLYGLALLCLLLVWIVGHTGKGAQRWLDLGLIRFQPSELMKIALPLTMAYTLDQYYGKLSTHNIGIALSLMIVPFLIIAKQPDLGTALLVFLIGLHMLMMVGLKARYLLYSLLLLIATAPLTWRYGLHSYQKKRILTLLFPQADTAGSGYHILQSKIAIGSGGWFGKGWNLGTQTHLNFLPEHNTDFVFALCAEEFGFVGCAFLLLMIFAIISRCLQLSFHGRCHFTQLSIASITFAFGLCSMINIAMVCGLIPVVGIPLPLMSYGGSTLLVTLMSFGFINACHRQPAIGR